MKNKKHLHVEIMAVGSELLTPYYQDTNSLYLTRRLNDLGIEVSYKTVVGDDWDNLTGFIKESLSRADVVIIMGGLGPTEDDRTREAVAGVLHKKLVFKPQVLKKIEQRFKRRNLSMPAVNRKQAYIMEGAEILENRCGTAPGLWVETDSQIIILFPGPPHELKPMFEKFAWPRLQKLKTQHTARRILKTTGLTESEIESIISPFYPEDPSLKLTTLAYPGQIEIHLFSRSAQTQDEAERNLNQLQKSIQEKLKDHVFSEQGEELEEVVGRLLRIHKKNLAVAESCTGGLLAHRLTNVPGSSDYFIQGVVAYSNQAKMKVLDVPPDIIEKHGAVSKQVAQAMAEGVRKKSCSHLGVGITGIAGPAGGTPAKPVGMVFVALAWDDGVKVSENLFLGPRKAVKFQSTQKGLDMVRRYFIKSL
ncbi:MAG: competence/damage-inducible protein A [Candidatus Aminicenantes bacterium]